MYSAIATLKQRVILLLIEVAFIAAAAAGVGWYVTNRTFSEPTLRERTIKLMVQQGGIVQMARACGVKDAELQGQFALHAAIHGNAAAAQSTNFLLTGAEKRQMATSREVDVAFTQGIRRTPEPWENMAARCEDVRGRLFAREFRAAELASKTADETDKLLMDDVRAARRAGFDPELARQLEKSTFSERARAIPTPFITNVTE